MENKLDNEQVNIKEQEPKKHNSVVLDNIISLKDSSDKTKDFRSSNINEQILNLNTNSLFAYQEMDQFSSLCDCTSTKCSNETESKIDELLDQSIITDSVNKNKRNSALDTLPDFLYKIRLPLPSEFLRFSQKNNKMSQHQFLQYKNLLYPLLLEKQKQNIDFQNINNQNILMKPENVNMGANMKTNIGARRRSEPNFQMNFPGFQCYNNNLNNNLNNNINFNNNNNNIYLQNNNMIPNFICNNPYMGKRNSQMLPINKLNINNFLQVISEQTNHNEKALKYYEEKSNCKQMEDNLEANKNNKIYFINFYNEIKFSIVHIINHQYGNYLMQKFFEILLYQENIQIFNEIFNIIREHLFEISIDNYGTRVIQKLLEMLQDVTYNYQTFEFIYALKYLVNNYLYELCNDKNGNHVFLKILKIIPKEKNGFLYNKLIEIIIDVSLLQQGVTILQTALEYATLEQKEAICNRIIENISKLINDKYGNYTIQTIILLNEEKLNVKIFKYITENVLELSKQKFSSNVIDKFIITNNNFSKKLISDILNKNLIKELIFDKYGNYVIQKAIHVSENDTEIFNEISKQIKPLINELKNNQIGKKIYDKIVKHYGDSFFKC